MPDTSRVRTFLFTDIEGSIGLWEREPERMPSALACHDRLIRAAVAENGGLIVKMTGDGVHAAFDDPLSAVHAALAVQHALSDPAATEGIALRVRCGLHGGANQRRDNDFFGSEVNRAARVMNAAHGGQVLLSQYVATLVEGRLPGDVALRDLGYVRLRDLSTPERVFQALHPELRREFPPLRSLEATPNNLPQQVTSFIGRERDLSEVKALLATSRLLTLHGAGGIGKTRLSLQVAADLLDDYLDGVWFVELAALVDQRLVPQALARVLGVQEESGRPVLEAVTKYLKDRQLLLILDNCEHLIDGCAALARHLLRSCGKLRILATTRERLNTEGETTYSVPSLSLPIAGETTSVTGLAQCEAGRLFLERASSVQHAFQQDLKDVNAVTDICRRLDGIPLAIELAAARVRSLSVEQIAARLSDRFRLLTHGDRAALPRQQTLRALIDWSYDLLAESERCLLRRLAVFAGGWTLEAAEVVGSGTGLDRHEAVDLLMQLVEKSLVVLDAQGDRYRLLDTVRQYAWDRLNECGEADAIRAAHFDFYLALADTARRELSGSAQGAWLARLDVERENLLSAHAWCDLKQCEAERGLMLAMSLRGYWRKRGLMDLGHRVMVEALTRTHDREPTELRCRGLLGVGQFCCFMGRYREAYGYLEASLKIARTLGDAARSEAALQLLGVASLGDGDLDRAREHLDGALRLAKDLGNKPELAAALNARAQLHQVEREFAAAEPLYTELTALATELGDRELLAVGLLNLAMVSISQGQTERSRELILQALGIEAESGSKPAGQSVIEVCAGLAASRERWETAAQLYGAAEALTVETGLHRAPADEAFLSPLIAVARRSLSEADFTAAASIGAALDYAEAIALARKSIG